jgi:hypothetical protein
LPERSRFIRSAFCAIPPSDLLSPPEIITVMPVDGQEGTQRYLGVGGRQAVPFSDPLLPLQHGQVGCEEHHSVPDLNASVGRGLRLIRCSAKTFLPDSDGCGNIRVPNLASTNVGNRQNPRSFVRMSSACSRYLCECPEWQPMSEKMNNPEQERVEPRLSEMFLSTGSRSGRPVDSFGAFRVG